MLMKSGLLLILCFLPGWVAADAKPRTKTVMLVEFTQFTLDIVPDLGTRFVFPFVLDEESDEVPFTLKITNPVFASTREKGRHFFVITLPPPLAGGTLPRYLGNLFVNVAGYNITVLLRSTPKTARHYSDVVFTLNPKDRQTLIRDAVKKQLQGIRADYRQKEKHLAKRARALALKRLGGLLLAGGEVNTVAEEKSFDLSDGSQAIVIVHKRHQYADLRIFTFELAYDGQGEQDLRIQDVQLFAKTIDDGEVLVPSVHAIDHRLRSGESARGHITTDAPELKDPMGFQLSISTSLGQLAMQW